MSIKRDLELMYELGSLRLVDRTWSQFGTVNTANTAEHTFRVIWIALLLVKQTEEPIDESKLIKMALVHDITETRTGDVQMVSRLYTDRKEELAIRDSLAGTALTEYELLHAEYERRQSIEAKIVKDADTLDCDLEIMEEQVRGGQIKQALESTRRTAVRERMNTAAAQKFQDAIYESNPQDWFVKGQNRFTSGDWRSDSSK